jgi:hypothetical protein
VNWASSGPHWRRRLLCSIQGAGTLAAASRTPAGKGGWQQSTTRPVLQSMRPANPPPLPSDAGLRERRRPNINPTLRLTGPHFFSSLTHSPTTSTSPRLTRPPRAFSSSEHHQSIPDRSTLQHLVKMKYSLALVAAASAMVAAQDISSLPECGVSH